MNEIINCFKLDTEENKNDTHRELIDSIIQKERGYRYPDYNRCNATERLDKSLKEIEARSKRININCTKCEWFFSNFLLLDGETPMAKCPKCKSETKVEYL